MDNTTLTAGHESLTELEMLERLFCRHVHNRMRQELRKESLYLSDQELLSFVGRMAPYPGCTMKQGYLDLMELLYQLDGLDVFETQTVVLNLPDEEIAREIRRLAGDFASFSEWEASLPPCVRAML